MNARISVAELVEAVRSSYRTIDIRVAAIKESEGWVNAFTIVRLTYEEPKNATERLLALQERHCAVKTETFVIALQARPMEEWEELCAQVEKGAILIDSFEVRLKQTLKIMDEASDLSPYQYEIRSFDGNRWPSIEVKLGRHERDVFSHNTLTKRMTLMGYSDAYEAVNLLCEMNVQMGRSQGYDLCLCVPVFARVSDVRILPKDKKLKATVARHESFSDLRGAVVARRGDFQTNEPAIFRIPIPGFTSSDQKTPIEEAHTTVDLPDVQANDQLEVWLMHPKIGEVHRLTSAARQLVPPAERNILFEALKPFCNESELMTLLIEPHLRRAPKPKDSAAFELRVSWLLSLFGYSCVVLADCEKLYSPGTKMERGSVDILAANQLDKTLLLVGCTLGVPGEKDFHNLLNVREILAREAFTGTSVRILPVVVTAARGMPPVKEIDGMWNYIPILDVDRLEKAVGLLQSGREARLSELLETASLPFGPTPHT